MTTGSLAGSPWLSRKIIGCPSLQASKVWGRLPPAGYLSGRLHEGGPALKILMKKTTRGPAPRSRPREGRLQEAGPPAGGQDRALRVCTHITVMRQGVATVKHATPESRYTHGHSASYGASITHLARHCCHVDHDVTRGELSVRPVGGGPP